MSWRTKPCLLALRDFGRTIGANRLIASLAWKEYEDRFGKLMLGSIRQGDVVWDVGANVGLYSRKFSDIVGPAGRVIAYEPSPANLQRLKEAVGSRLNVTVLPIALGQSEAAVFIEQGSDPLGATSRIVSNDKAMPGREGAAEVRLSSGDLLVSSGTIDTPNVIKIDTEGFELNVLLGLKRTLLQRHLRAVCVEVHFGLLSEQGLHRAPQQIEELLASSGFSVTWPDASHIVATRKNECGE